MRRPSRPVARSLAAAAALCLCVPALSKNWALVIGINEYQNVRAGIPELKFAIADAEAVDDQLTNMGYDTHRLENDGANRKNIVRELNRYAHLVQPDDTFLLYFAGHGVRRSSGESQAYWLTYAAELDALDDEGIRLAHLLDFVRDIPARKKIVLLDHCFSGDAVDQPTGSTPVDASATATGGTATGGTRAAGRLPMELRMRGVMTAEQLRDQVPASAKGTLVVAAARNEAIESPTFRHGFFTQALLKALSTREASEGKPTLTVSQLVSYLRAQVAALSSSKQQVAEFSSGTDMSSWIFAERLPEPAVNMQAAQLKRAKYNQTLVDWENSDWMKFNERKQCSSVLEAWLKSLDSSGPALNDVQKRILLAIEKHMDGSDTPESMAKDLQLVIENILRAPA